MSIYILSLESLCAVKLNSLETHNAAVLYSGFGENNGSILAFC